MLLLAALVYIAHSRSSVKTYLFQTGNSVNQRIGELYDIKSISADGLRNKLIEKYLSEFFKVVPGETDIATKRKVLKNMSHPSVFDKWTKDEMPIIQDMANKHMLRLIKVDSITNQNVTSVYKDTTTAYYKIRYHIITWTEPNIIDIQPVKEDATIFMEVSFEPTLRKDSNDRTFSAKKLVEYLKNGENPAALFVFGVQDINVKSKENSGQQK